MFLLSIALAAAQATDRPAGQGALDHVRPVAPPIAEGGGAAARPDALRYCIEETPTGTRIPHRTCRTRKEWLDHGVDPLEKD